MSDEVDGPEDDREDALAPYEDLLLSNEEVARLTQNADPTVSIEEVRKSLSKIDGSLSDSIRKERDA